jgi:hypothetical protein
MTGVIHSKGRQGMYPVMSDASFLSHGRLKLSNGADVAEVWSFTSVCTFVQLAWA